MKITHTKDLFDEDRIEFMGTYIDGCVYEDGSGELYVAGTTFYQDHGTHKQRVKDLKKLTKTLVRACHELDQLELKLKQVKNKSKTNRKPIRKK